MNIAAHKTLYESGIAFGLRETLRAEQGKAETEKRVKDLNYLKTCIIESNQLNFRHFLRRHLQAIQQYIQQRALFAKDNLIPECLRGNSLFLLTTNLDFWSGGGEWRTKEATGRKKSEIWHGWKENDWKATTGGKEAQWRDSGLEENHPAAQGAVSFYVNEVAV